MNYDVIITPFENKMNILASQKGITRTKFMTLDDLVEAFYFSIKPEALLLVSEKFGLTYSITEEILEIVPFINDDAKENEKIKLCKKVKKFLIDNDLIIKDEAKKTILLNNNVSIVGYPYSKKLNLLAGNLGIKLDKTMYNVPEKLNVNKGKNFVEEINFVLQDIITKKNDLNYSDFSIINVSEEDFPIVKKFATFYKVPVNVPYQASVTHSNEFNNFLEYLKNDSNFNELLSHPYSADFQKKIVDIINKYELKDENIKQYTALFKYLLKRVSYVQESFSDSVKLNNFNAKYKYYVNFNEGLAPSIVKDDKFFDDDTLSILGFDTTSDINSSNFNEVTRIVNLPNLTISYHTTDSTGNVLPSSLMPKDAVVEDIKYAFGLSEEADMYHLEHAYEYYQLFGIKDESLEQYAANFIKEGFDNSFKFTDEKSYKEYIKKNLIKLSYSACDDYAKCPFRYYLSKILGLSTFSQTIITNLGTYAHSVLERHYNPNQKETLDEEFNRLFTTPLEKFIAKEYESVANELIEFNDNIEKESSINNVLTELEVKVDLEDNMIFKGIIDKLVYKIDGDKAYIAIVDYKTSDSYKPTLANLEYGLNLQLFTYLYLINHLDEVSVNGEYIFKDKEIRFVGAYYQKVLYQNFEKADDYLNRFMLEGFTVNSNDAYGFDPTLVSGCSSYIKKLQSNSEGLKNSGKKTEVLQEEFVKSLVSLMDKRIEFIKDAVMNLKYEIKPILLSDGTDGCKYCPYKHVCYMKYRDYDHQLSKQFEGDGEIDA